MPFSGAKTDFLLSNALNELLLKLPKHEFRQMAQEVHEACLQRGITYIHRDNTTRVIPLMLSPRVINPIQRGYFHYVCLQIIDALQKLCAAYISEPQARKRLPLSESEKQWLLDAWRNHMPPCHTVSRRPDPTPDFSTLTCCPNLHSLQPN